MEGVNQAVTALSLPASAAAPLAEAMALASVNVFMYLHRLRFQPSTPAQARPSQPRTIPPLQQEALPIMGG